MGSGPRKAWGVSVIGASVGRFDRALRTLVWPTITGKRRIARGQGRVVAGQGGQGAGQLGRQVGKLGGDAVGGHAVGLGKDHVEGDGHGARLAGGIDQPGHRLRGQGHWPSASRLRSSMSMIVTGNCAAWRGRNCW